MTVYDYVKQLATRRNITISKIERDLSLGNGTISKWVNSIPKADVLFKLSNYFDVPMEYFITGNLYTEEEVNLINSYRRSNERTKMRVRQLLNDPDGDLDVVYQILDILERKKKNV